MITASHNPPEYNGYKVYWNDGAQVLPPHDTGIVKEIDLLRGKGVVSASTPNDPYIHVLYQEIDSSYLEAIRALQLYPATDKSSLHVVYSPLHGTGGVIVPQALYQTGVKTLSFVRPQMVADGTFSTTPIPNPESPEALRLGIEQMMKEEADLFLATDPDADRLGVVVNHHGSPVILTGNQIASIMLEGILSCRSFEKALPARMSVVETIVTTPLVKAIAEKYGGKTYQVLPGF
jgi:phosphomannomutase